MRPDGKTTRKTRTSRRQDAQASEPMRLFVVVRGDSAHGGTFTARSDADTYASLTTNTRVVEFIEVCQPPPRATAWGPGQHAYCQLGPGVQAGVRVTKDGRMKLTIVGGDIDISEGGALMALGILEANARAAQIRERIKERAWKRAQKAKSK